MKLINMTVIDFINDVDSPSPAPGGGSVSAIVGSLSCALARMVGHLTINKKKYAELSEDIKDKFMDSFNELKVIEVKLNEIIDKDTENFNILMAAVKMPKDSVEEKKNRDEKMQEATIMATETPMDILRLTFEIFSLLDIFKEYGNKNALSDVAVAYVLAYAGAKGALLNVNINIPSIKDIIIAERYKEECKKHMEYIESRFVEIQDKISLFKI